MIPRTARGAGPRFPRRPTDRVTNRGRSGQNGTVAGHTRPSVNKRLREAQKKERQAAKAERRAQRAADREKRTPAADGEDPDIAGIVPGPQALPWEDDEPEEPTP
jgi:hypothetical protein